jgi:hypothetical protein
MSHVKKTTATGVEGMILDYGRTFRVSFGKPVNEAGDWYKDYDICHPDMKVKITDSDAYFYEDENGNTYVDMSDHLDIKMREELKDKE